MAKTLREVFEQAYASNPDATEYMVTLISAVDEMSKDERNIKVIKDCYPKGMVGVMAHLAMVAYNNRKTMSIEDQDRLLRSMVYLCIREQIGSTD